MMVRPWTADEDARLEELVAAGKSHTEIAAELGKSRNATLGRWHRILVNRGHIPSFRNRSSETGAGEALRNTTPKRVYRRKIPEPALPAAGVGFLLPAIVPAPSYTEGSGVAITDLSGCKWPLREDASLTGGFAFCNDAKKDPACPYCAHHAKLAYVDKPRVVPKSIGSYGLRFGRRAAA